MEKIVILGGGFAGMRLARGLRNKQYDVTIIDQYNFHQFQPLFYQVATARLEPSSISFPLRKVFQGKSNVKVRISKINRVDTVRKVVITKDAEHAYDKLVIATGCRTNYFGNENLEKFAYPMKSTNDALAIRNRILSNFEKAVYAQSESEKAALLTIAIAGGGPTGVELAGALSEMRQFVLPRDYPDMDFSGMRILLLEGGSTVLGAMDPISQEKAKTYLQDLGVELCFNTMVQDFDGEKIILKDQAPIVTKNLIWAAGITSNVPDGLPEDCLVRGNRIKVNPYSEVEGLDGVYAIGDISYMESPEWPMGHPQLANVANNQSENLKKNLLRLLNGQSMQPFKYKNPGTMATVGKRKAVVELPTFKFQGRFAWFLWMFLHLMLILSIKNKLFTFITWTISYFTNDTTLRLWLTPTAKDRALSRTTNVEMNV